MNQLTRLAKQALEAKHARMKVAEAAEHRAADATAPPAGWMTNPQGNWVPTSHAMDLCRVCQGDVVPNDCDLAD
jgi:hypothetical protein